MSLFSLLSVWSSYVSLLESLKGDLKVKVGYFGVLLVSIDNDCWFLLTMTVVLY